MTISSIWKRRQRVKVVREDVTHLEVIKYRVSSQYLDEPYVISVEEAHAFKACSLVDAHELGWVLKILTVVCVKNITCEYCRMHL